MNTERNIHSEESKQQSQNHVAVKNQNQQKRHGIFSELLTPVDRMFEEFFGEKQNPIQKRYDSSFFEKRIYPQVDIRDTNQALIIEAAIPGMKKEDVQVDVRDGVLTVSAEIKEEKVERDKYIYQELKRSSFSRSWSLADYLDQENIRAEFREGMLYLTIPKLQTDSSRHKSRKIEIK